MESTNVQSGVDAKFRKAIISHLSKHDLTEVQKNQLVNELDVLSNLIIDAYLEKQYDVNK